MLSRKAPETPEIQTIHGTQTSESLSTAPVRQVALECVKVHPAGLEKPDDPDAQIKFVAAETLHGIHRNRFAKELRRRDCMMGEMWKNKPPFRVALNTAASDEIARHCKHWTESGVMKLYESGTALAEGMRVPVSKMEELIAAHCQTSLKTVKDPDRRPYPAYPSGKSWCEACGKMGSGQKFYHNVTPGSDFAAEAQQQHQEQQASTHQASNATKRKKKKKRVKERRNEEVRKEGKRMGERVKKRE